MATWIQTPAGGTCCECRAAVCDSCCPAISSVQCRTRSASKTKCGFPEWPGYESTPPKIYLVVTLAGTLTAKAFFDTCVTCDHKSTIAYSGTCSFSRPGCAETDAGVETTTSYPDCVTAGAPTTTPPICDVVVYAGYTESFTATVHTVTGTGCTGGTPSSDFTGSSTATLSSEYTTAQLRTDADTALAAASWSAYGGTCSNTLTTYSTDELTITLRDVGYRFNFASATPSGCKLTFDIYTGTGSFVGSVCVDLSTGISSYDYELDHSATTNEELYITNWAIASGAC